MKRSSIRSIPVNSVEIMFAQKKNRRCLRCLFDDIFVQSERERQEKNEGEGEGKKRRKNRLIQRCVDFFHSFLLTFVRSMFNISTRSQRAISQQERTAQSTGHYQLFSSYPFIYRSVCPTTIREDQSLPH